MLLTKWWFWLIIIVSLVFAPTLVALVGKVFIWVGDAFIWLANLVGNWNFLKGWLGL